MKIVDAGYKIDLHIYSGLKANEGNGSIVKVFPGIEFSVEFIGGDEDAVVHVIAIFDDSNEEKVKKINKKDMKLDVLS